MPYTFKPEKKFAKAFGRNLRISTKTATKLCRVIRGKTLKRAKHMLDDLLNRKRSLEGKYHTKTVKQIKQMLESCEKNAEFLGLDSERLFVYASAHMGTIMHRRRRKAAFGSRMKSTNLEIMLEERGKQLKISKKKIEESKKSEVEKEIERESREMKKQVGQLKKTAEKIKDKKT